MSAVAGPSGKIISNSLRLSEKEFKYVKFAFMPCKTATVETYKYIVSR